MAMSSAFFIKNRCNGGTDQARWLLPLHDTAIRKAHMVGLIGSVFITVAFVATLLGGLAYLQASRKPLQAAMWERVGWWSWITMTGSLLVASGLLFYLLVTHQFQYAYVFSYTSRDLPTYYLVSAFWAGQEGSFILWGIYAAIIGLLAHRWSGRFRAPVMVVLALSQAFLLSMIVGLKLGPLSIGSSPFMMLAEKFPEAPMLQVPGFVPADGNGLNDLLKNWWMVIHPPTLFLGFASMAVPFAFAVAGLWKREYTAWVRPTLPWLLFASMVLMAGISMGGYWAYVTLSFGGYWAWDPVENSSFVPWLLGVAALHMMLVQRKTSAGHKGALLLTMLAYLTVIYSTFLTRSGILGDISVHSFVDLGLHNQLVLWLVVLGVLGLGLFGVRYRELPASEREMPLLSREFFIFTGALFLSTIALVILLGTSSPILGKLFRNSPSAVPIEFYNKWTLPLAVVVALLVGAGQLLWWQRMRVEELSRMLLKPVTLSVVSTLTVLLLTPFIQTTVQVEALAPSAGQEAGWGGELMAFWQAYGQSLLLLLLLFASFFALYGNALVLWRVSRGNPRMAGGSITHVGFALMLLGILFSSAMNDPISDGNGVMLGGKSRDNFIISRGQTLEVDGYRVTYSGKEKTPEGYTAYLLDFTTPEGHTFTARPVVYKSNKDQWIQHPYIQPFFEKDIYIAVAPNIMFEKPEAVDRKHEVFIVRGESRILGNNEYAVTFKDFDLNVERNQLPEDVEIAVAARLEVRNLQTGEARTVAPIYAILKDRRQYMVPAGVEDWGLVFTFAGMKVDEGAIHLIVDGAEIMPEDWLIVQAYEKPFINVLWIGILLMMVGFAVAMNRRIQDYQIRRSR